MRYRHLQLLRSVHVTIRFAAATLFCCTVGQTNVAAADEQYSSECAKRVADIVRIIEREFDRGPISWEEPFFFGLFSFTYVSYSVLDKNADEVSNSVPIENCSEEDFYEGIKATKLKKIVIKKTPTLQVDFETKHKEAQIVFDRKKKRIRSANVHVSKPLME